MSSSSDVEWDETANGGKRRKPTKCANCGAINGIDGVELQSCSKCHAAVRLGMSSFCRWPANNSFHFLTAAALLLLLLLLRSFLSSRQGYCSRGD